MTLGGFTMLRRATELDFCWRQCILSMLPVCETVSVSVASDDPATEKEVRQWMTLEPKLSLNIYDWVEPKADLWWLNKWIQYAREHTRADYVLQLDADEVLDDASHDEIRQFKRRPGRFAVNMHRLNFWKDHRHLIPSGQCCSDRVNRMAPQNLYLPSDGYDPKGTEVSKIAVKSNCRIFHYGFIRQPEKFFQKEEWLQGAYFGTYDPRLRNAEPHGKDWAVSPGVVEWTDKLVPTDAHHPAPMHQWIAERHL